MVKILSPKNDVVFQKLFGSVENKNILISFLNSILTKAGNEEIKEVTIEEKRLDVTMVADEKLSILDIHVTTNDNVNINVEIQLINQYNMIERTLFYWSKMYMKQIKRGGNYADLNKTITINILDFDYIDIEKFHSWYHLYESDIRYRLTDLVEIHFIEMDKFKKANKEYSDKLHRWLQFLQNPTGREVKDIMEYDDRIKEAMDILSYISGDEEVVKLAEMRAKAIRDEESRLKGAKEEGKKEGREEGREEGIKLVKKVFKLFNNGESISSIAKICEVSEEKVKEIIEE